MSNSIPYGTNSNNGAPTIAEQNAIDRKKVLKSIGVGAAAVNLKSLMTGYQDISTMFNANTSKYTGTVNGGGSDEGLDYISPMSVEAITSSSTYEKEYGMDMTTIVYDESIVTDSSNYDMTNSNNPSPAPIDPSSTYSRAWRAFWDYGLALGSPGVPPLNVSFQSNMLDDIRYTTPTSDPLVRFQPKSNDRIGRVYGERIKKNWRAVQFQIGKDVSNINALDAIFGKQDIEGNYKQLREEGGIIGGITQSLANLGSFFSDAVSSFFNAKGKLINFRETMNVYFDYVNELMFDMAVSLGLTDPSTSGQPVNGTIDPSTSAPGTTPTPSSGTKPFFSPWGGFQYAGGHPDIGGRLDIRQFLGSNKSLGYGDSSSGNTGKGQMWNNGFLQKIGNAVGSVIDSTENLVGQAASDLLLYIPFLLSSDISVSETWSNSTEEHPLMGQINEAAQKNYTQNAEGGANVISSLQSGGFSGLTGAVLDWTKSKAASAVLSTAPVAELAAVQSGVGRISLPEIWSGSSFDRSYSLTFKFYSPYGDKLSVFENVMIPTLCLLAMAAPKQVGNNSFMSPFLIRAYAVGLFACNYGMVTSLTLTKGNDKNDMTIDGLSKMITATLVIKDLIPDFMISMNKGAFNHASNTQLLDWMWIMSAQSLSYKDYIFKNTNFFLARIKRAFQNFSSLSNISDTVTNVITSNGLIRGGLNFVRRFFPNNNGFEASTELRNGTFTTGSGNVNVSGF